MVERRKANSEERGSSRHPVSNTMDSLKEQLSIDQDDLAACLQNQPDLYYHVADEYASVVAERDQLKLDLEEATAELDGQFRASAASEERKITEAGLQREIALAPRIKNLERDILIVSERLAKWGALKEAFQQRSFMLRELVAIRIAEWGNTTLDRGVRGAQRNLAEANAEATAEMRRARRER